MSELHRQMAAEQAAQQLFDQAHHYGRKYLQTMPVRNVYPTAEALNALAAFDEPLPQQPEDGAELLELLHRCGSPATVAQGGGRFFSFVDGGVIPAAQAARLLADYWDQNCALYEMSPLVAKLGAVCEGWLRELFGMPERMVASFVTGSSVAILCGLAAARWRLLQRQGWDVSRQGLAGAPRLRLVAGEEVHGTVEKAVSLLGFGLDCIELVTVDRQGRLEASQLPPLDENTIVILQAGNVCSGAFDPIAEVCRRAKAAGAWVHIDGAFGLWAAACRELRHLTAGLEQADSFSMDGHKTLNTPYDNGILLCNDGKALAHAMQASGSYLGEGGERNAMFATPEMSQRARAVELWAALKYMGRSGVDALVLGQHRRAQQFAAELQEAGFEVLNEVVFNQVVVSCGPDELTRRVKERLLAGGECQVGGATWQGRVVIRVSVCSWVTTTEDVSRSVGAFVAAREEG